MKLPFAALHQLCAPLRDWFDRLPGPQRNALATTFGLSAGTVLRRERRRLDARDQLRLPDAAERIA